MRLAYRFIACACTLAALCAAAQDLAIVPVPASVQKHEGAFALSGDVSVVVAAAGKESLRVGENLASLLNRSHGLTLAVSAGKPRDGAIVLEHDPRAGAGIEAYRLDVTPQRITISASTAVGLFRGVTTLWQMVPPRGAAANVPAATILDAPRFGWRGVMLDSARHFQSPEFVLRFIDAMALEKLNVLHWHLADDQAWRLEIRKYPKLTSVGAWRVPAGRAPRNDIDPATGKPRLYGGFYSQQDVRRIVAYAAERGITVVPEIDMPGHVTAAMVAYPKLAAIADPPREVPADWGIYPHAYSLEDGTFNFIEDVLTEVMALFPSRYIHVGGDEVEKGEWKASARGQALMRQMNTTDPERLQMYFTQRLGKFLQAHGRRMVGWDEVLAPGLPNKAVVMSWRGVDGALAAAQHGFDTVIAAWPTFYFDNRQDDSPSEPPGRGRVISLEDVYKFDPMPATIKPADRVHVLGVQGNVWTEHIRTEERVGWMTFPRAAAVAEIGWSQPTRRDYASFVQRVSAQRPLFDAIGMTYAKSAFDPPKAAAATTRRMSQQLELCSDDLAISLEDDAPLQGPRAKFLVDIQNPCWMVRKVDFSRAKSLTAAVGQVPFNFQIGEAASKIAFPAPTTPEGELQVRLGSCDGKLIASMPLALAAKSDEVTVLPSVPLEGEGVQDLCLRFSQHKLDPIWVIDWIDFAGGAS
jgi:hexosaminidase